MSGQQRQREESQGGVHAQAEARSMLSAFISVGVGAFGVTRKNTEGKAVGYVRVEAHELLGRLANLLPAAERKCHSVIIRPFYETETLLTLVQVDDLDLARAKRLVPFSFCITETSPANFQAFVCIADGAGEYATLRRQMNAASNADRGATCAGRLAGSLNTKLVHRRDDGSFPRVRLAHVASGLVVKVEDLRAAGLLADVIPQQPRVVANLTRFRRPNNYAPPAHTHQRRIPSYAKALADVQRKDNGEPDRSAADLLFAVTCLRWRPPLTSEEIAALLMEHSEKARERKDAEWYVETTIQEAKRRMLVDK